MSRVRILLPIVFVLVAMGASCGGGGGAGDAISGDALQPDAPDPCVPACDGRACGPDGCGGDCGTCEGDDDCRDGACVPSSTTYPDACLGAGRPSAPSCGEVKRQGCCDEVGRVVWCERGALYCVDCSASGTACGWKDEPVFTGYDCGGDGVDPSGWFPRDCDESCEPDCADGMGGTRECGPDGCGGRCGACARGRLCDAAGACIDPPGGLVQGKLEYEARVPKFDPLEGPALDPIPIMLPAAGLPVTVSDASGAVVGEAIVGDDGRFEVPLSRSVLPDDALVFAAIGDGPVVPTFAILRPEAGGPVASVDPPVWAWSRTLDGPDAGTIRVTEAQGSGAIHLFRLVASAMETVVGQMAGGDPTQWVPLALLWAPGVSWDCGYCYAARMPQVPAQGIHLPDSVFLDGHLDGSSAWAAAAVLHEVGHGVLRNLSRNDAPGGSHWLGDLLIPPFAWVEGWTNFFGVAAHSRFLGMPDARLWAVVFGASGTRVAFWMDLAAGEGAAAGTASPDPDAGMTQRLDERWVARVLWELWDGDDVSDAGLADDCELGTGAMSRALVSRRMLRQDRGDTGADLVDFLDALICEDPGRFEAVDSLVRVALGFPYDGAATCP